MTCFHDKECGDEILLCAKDGNKKVGGQLQHITRAGKQNPFRFPERFLRYLEISSSCPLRGTRTPQVHVEQTGAVTVLKLNEFSTQKI